MPITGWFNWAGDCIEGRGVAPHVHAEILRESLAKGVDEQLQRAISLTELKLSVTT
jgi:hypothetical protein